MDIKFNDNDNDMDFVGMILIEYKFVMWNFSALQRKLGFSDEQYAFGCK